jgi:hypothetical protein
MSNASRGHIVSRVDHPEDNDLEIESSVHPLQKRFLLVKHQSSLRQQYSYRGSRPKEQLQDQHPHFGNEILEGGVCVGT